MSRVLRLHSASRWLHRWVGLALGLVLLVMGGSGSLIAWNDELDGAFNPELLSVQAPVGVNAGAPMAWTPARAAALLRRLTEDARYGQPDMLNLARTNEDVVIAWYRQKKPARQVMVNPHTLAVTGERPWGEVAFARAQIMPTVYALHRFLLGGDVGRTVVAWLGLALALVSLAGWLAWWPGASLAALRQASLIAYRGSALRLAFSGHRSLGAWGAPLLIFFGLSGSYFNAPDWFRPWLAHVLPMQAKPPAVLPASAQAAGVDVATAVQVAMAAYPGAELRRVTLPGRKRADYEIRLRRATDWRAAGGVRVSVSAADGQITRRMDSSSAPAGDRLLDALFPLHSGEAFGVLGRCLVSVCGVLPGLLALTGWFVWWRKRQARNSRREEGKPA